MAANIGNLHIAPVENIPDEQLLFDEDETRQILKFFWPERAAQIDSLAISNEWRRCAQKYLIAAIDASYQMGYVEILFNGVGDAIKGKPGGKVIKGLAKKFAKYYIKHWWKSTKPKNLEDIKIYESVRRTIAYQYATVFEIDAQGAFLQKTVYHSTRMV